MAGPMRRKRVHRGDHPISHKYRARRKTRDMDQIFCDLKNTKDLKSLVIKPIDIDVVGLAQHYCIHCAKHFQDEKTLENHLRTKPHKRRVKALEEQPYTQKEADACAGLSRYHKPWLEIVPSMEEIRRVYKVGTSVKLDVNMEFMTTENSDCCTPVNKTTQNPPVSL